MAADEPSSREIWKYFKEFLQRAKPGIAFETGEGAVFLSRSSADWATAIKKVLESDSDGVLMRIRGGEFIDFVKRAGEADLFGKKQEFLVVMGSLSELIGLGVEMPEGIWWSSPYWFQASRSPVNLRFAENYEKKYGAPPSWPAQFAYGAVKAYAEAVKKAVEPGQESVIASLEGLVLNLPVGRVTIRPEDHQAIMHAMAGRTSRISVTERKRSFRALGNMRLFRVKEIVESDGQSDCRMQ
jgi:branched-chain amino acid transport system substrate-binding protein